VVQKKKGVESFHLARIETGIFNSLARITFPVQALWFPGGWGSQNF